MEIRLATPHDLPAIVSIYNLAIQKRGSTSDLTPLTVEARRSWFADHHPHENPIWVATERDEVIGWCSLSPYFPGRKGLIHTKEISFYVHLEHHRQGVGSALIQHAIAACPKLETRTLFAILLDHNHASAALLEKLGFERWGHLPRVSEIDGEEHGHYYYGKRLTP